MPQRKDAPVQKISEDKLGYSKFAFYIAKAIWLLEDINTSFVIGISGKWGDGKSSVLNFIENFLNYFQCKNIDSNKLNNDEEIIKEIKKLEEQDHCFTIKETTNINYVKIIGIFIISISISLLINYFAEVIVENINLILILIVSIIGLLIYSRKIRKACLNLWKNVINPYYVLKKENKILWIEFNPWNFIKGEDIVSEFFKELSKNINASDSSDEANNLVSLISAYGALLGKNFDFLKNILETNTSVKSLKEQIEKSLKNYKNKIVIVIDDIDRMEQKEAKLIFQMVRLLANFPNIIYILSYDKEVVEGYHWGNNRVKGIEYLKKIIQLNKNLPIIKSSKLKDIFISSIKDIIKDFQYNEERLTQLYDFGIFVFINNLRDINHLENALKLIVGAYKNIDIDIIDLVGLTAIEIFDNDAFNYIKANKQRLLCLYSKAEVSKNIKEIENISNFKSLPLLNLLFPNYFIEIEKQFEESVVNNVIHKNKKEEFNSKLLLNASIDDVFTEKYRRLSDIEYFDNYFILSFDIKSITQDEVELLLSPELLNNVDKFKEKLLDLSKDNEDTIFDFMIYLNTYKGDTYRSYENILTLFKNFLYFTSPSLDKIIDSDQMIREFLALIKKAKKKLNKEPFFNILKETIKNNGTFEQNLIYTLKWISAFCAKNINSSFKKSYSDTSGLLEVKNIIKENLPTHALYGNILALVLLNSIGINIDYKEYSKELLKNRSDLIDALKNIKYYGLDENNYFNSVDIEKDLLELYYESEENLSTEERVFKVTYAGQILIKILKVETTVANLKGSLQQMMPNQNTINSAFLSSLNNLYDSNFPNKFRFIFEMFITDGDEDKNKQDFNNKMDELKKRSKDSYTRFEAVVEFAKEIIYEL